MHFGRSSPGALARRLMRPTGAEANALVYAAAVALVWGEGWLPGGVFVTLIGVALAAAYFGSRAVRAVARVVLTSYYGHALPVGDPTVKRPTRVLGLAVLLCLLDVPRFVFVTLHLPLLYAYVEQVHAHTPVIELEQPLHGFVGLMYVTDVRVEPSDVRMTVGPRGELLFVEAPGGYDCRASPSRIDLYRALCGFDVDLY